MILPILAAVVLGHFVAVSIEGQPRTSTTTARSITVVTEPNASIWLNGVFFGKASEAGTLTVDTPPPGRKSLRVRADGFKEAIRILTPVQQGQISVPLTKTNDGAELAFQAAVRFSVLDREKAVGEYRRAIELRPSYTDAHIGLARTLIELAEYREAELAVAAARRTSPGNAEVSAVEGRLLKSVGEEEKAAAAFRRAIREGGAIQPEANTGLGLIHRERAEMAGAEGDFDREAAEYKEAAKYLSTAIKQLAGAPESIVIYQHLGLMYEQQNKAAEAISVYREFLRLFPKHPEAPAFESYIVQLQRPVQ
ncbi:MAG TPA: tetratricopeptide repeat protein [Pyrinomonadaceae bacterium]|nr:tetratricopeptide repeat protein [Pyrinomonadaceae bacterium]